MPVFIHGRNTRVCFSNGHSNIGYDLSQFFNDVSISNEAEAAETTTFQSGANKSYILGLKSGVYTISGYYDSTENTGVDYLMSQAVGTAPFLITDPITDHQENTIVVWPQGGSTENERCWMSVGIATKYDLKSSVSTVVSLDAEVTADLGVRSGRGEIFTANGESTGTVHFHTTPLDAGAASSNGGLLIVGVLSLEGTSPAINLTFQMSADNSTWVDATTNAQVWNSVEALELQSGQLHNPMYRYTRLDWTLSGADAVAEIYYGFARF